MAILKCIVLYQIGKSFNSRILSLLTTWSKTTDWFTVKFIVQQVGIVDMKIRFLKQTNIR